MLGGPLRPRPRRRRQDASHKGKPFTIVGVTRQWFMGMTPGEPPDITIPIVAAPFDPQSRALLTTFVTGRLRTGATIEQVRAQLASFWPELLLATVPTQSPGPPRRPFPPIRPPRGRA